MILRMKNHGRFQDSIVFPPVIFQIKELVHITENKSNKHMSNNIYDFWC